jgi:RNA polymerase sigma-70 factor (ECF subfamily)
MVVTVAIGAIAITQAASFEEVFRSGYHRVVGIAVVTTGDLGLAEDAAQEAFARANRRWEQVGSLDRPDLWIARVAVRVAIDGWRRRRHEAGPPSASEEAPVPDVVRSLWIRHSLETLSPAQRSVVLLRYVEGLPVDDVARALGRSRATIRTHVAAARRRLRIALRQDDE